MSTCLVVTGSFAFKKTSTCAIMFHASLANIRGQEKQQTCKLRIIIPSFRKGVHLNSPLVQIYRTYRTYKTYSIGPIDYYNYTTLDRYYTQQISTFFIDPTYLRTCWAVAPLQAIHDPTVPSGSESMKLFQ